MREDNTGSVDTPKGKQAEFDCHKGASVTIVNGAEVKDQASNDSSHSIIDKAKCGTALPEPR